VTSSVTAPGDANLSDATEPKRVKGQISGLFDPLKLTTVVFVQSFGHKIK